MSQTNTNTNNGPNWNQISGRSERGRGGPVGRSRGDCSNGHGNNLIANKYPLEGEMKDGIISKLIIIETRHRPI